jgi:hypothetical protein
MSEEELTSVAAEVGDMLGWDDARRADEVRSFQAEWEALFAPPRPGQRAAPSSNRRSDHNTRGSA